MSKKDLRQDVVEYLRERGHGIISIQNFLQEWAADEKVPTKRELFAAMAMQGMLAAGPQAPPEHKESSIKHKTEHCVRLADALIAELEKKGGEK